MPEERTARYFTVEEYLAFEESASVRHEYVAGQVFAMSGATNRHNIIAGNIYSSLRAHLRGSLCRAYISDVKARVEEVNSFYYPDVMVSCEAFDRKTVYNDRPLLLVEVLSRSTATIDRREKMLAYKKLSSLKEYLIVHQSKRHVELHRRIAQDQWEMLEISQKGEIVLHSMPAGPLTMSLNAIYEDAGLDQETDLQVREVALEGHEQEVEGSAFDW